MSFLSIPKSPSTKKYDELNKAFNSLQEGYDRVVIQRNELAARYLSLQQKHTSNVIETEGLRAHYQKAENEHINMIVEMKPIFEIYRNEISELTGAELLTIGRGEKLKDDSNVVDSGFDMYGEDEDEGY